ncbi:SDR family oxidoreductase [Balneolales bacterium ANBcel1]|nr:SDR family oxidoreductase [Balneolales bacterium ANBcel1]
MSFQKKNVIVTGAANGIGRVIARTFAEKGAFVALADIDDGAGKALEHAIREDGFGARFFHADVSDPGSVEKLIKHTTAACGSIDILINNAGVSEFTPFYNLTTDEWDRILNTNLRGAFLCARESARVMCENGGGSIVNIASTRALMSEPGSEAYAASKGGLLALTHALALSLADDRITVNAVSPGWIHTGDYTSLRDIDHQQHPSRRVGRPADIARACLFLCDPENNFITGENLVIDGGMTRKMIYEH